MILRSFASNQPYVLAALPIMVGVALVPAFFGSPLQVIPLELPLDHELGFLYSNPTAMVWGALIMVLAGSWLSNAVFNKSEFFNTPTYVVSLLYTFFASLTCLFQLNFSILLAGLFVLLGLERQLNIFKQTRVLSLCFEAGFWFGLAALLFPPYCTLLMGAWVALIFNRAFNLREHLLLLISFGLPFLYWVVYLYVCDAWDRCVLFSVLASFDQLQPQQGGTSWLWYVIILAAVGVIMSIPRYLAPADRSGNKTKMVKNTFLIMALSMLLSVVLAFRLYHLWVVPAGLVVVVILLGYWFANYRFSLMAPLVFYALMAIGAIAVGSHYWAF